MPYFPTWLDNLLLLVAFVWVSQQYRIADAPNRIMNPRFAMMVLCAGLMVMVTFLNHRGSWVSAALFGATVLCVLAIIQLQRSMPPKEVDN